MRTPNHVDLDELKKLYSEGYTHRELCKYFHTSSVNMSKIIKENRLTRTLKTGRPRKTLIENFKVAKAERKPRNNEYACPVCGKVFYDYVSSVAGKWPYQRCINNRERKICTWTCCVKFDKLSKGEKKDEY